MSNTYDTAKTYNERNKLGQVKITTPRFKATIIEVSESMDEDFNSYIKNIKVKYKYKGINDREYVAVTDLLEILGHLKYGDLYLTNISSLKPVFCKYDTLLAKDAKEKSKQLVDARKNKSESGFHNSGVVPAKKSEKKSSSNNMSMAFSSKVISADEYERKRLRQSINAEKNELSNTDNRNIKARIAEKILSTKLDFNPVKEKAKFENDYWENLEKGTEVDVYFKGLPYDNISWLSVDSYDGEGDVVFYKITGLDYEKVTKVIKTNFAKVKFANLHGAYDYIWSIKDGSDTYLVCCFNGFDTFEIADLFTNSMSGIDYSFNEENNCFEVVGILDSFDDDDKFYLTIIRNELRRIITPLVKNMGVKINLERIYKNLRLNKYNSIYCKLDNAEDDLVIQSIIKIVQTALDDEKITTECVPSLILEKVEEL